MEIAATSEEGPVAELQYASFQANDEPALELVIYMAL
jgi:hypothetical protein